MDRAARASPRCCATDDPTLWVATKLQRTPKLTPHPESGPRAVRSGWWLTYGAHLRMNEELYRYQQHWCRVRPSTSISTWCVPSIVRFVLANIIVAMKDLSGFHDLPLAKQHAMLEGPAMKPPLGTKSNFAHPPNQDTMGLGILIAVTIVATLLVASRMYARVFYHKKMAVQDGEWGLCKTSFRR